MAPLIKGASATFSTSTESGLEPTFAWPAGPFSRWALLSCKFVLGRTLLVATVAFSVPCRFVASLSTRAQPAPTAEHIHTAPLRRHRHRVPLVRSFVSTLCSIGRSVGVGRASCRRIIIIIINLGFPLLGLHQLRTCRVSPTRKKPGVSMVAYTPKYGPC